MDFCVSVIMPVLNMERYIEKAIKSVYIQKEVTSIIVINDGSTDKTGKILNDLALEIPYLIVLCHKDNINKGRSASRNLGIKHVSTEYVAFLDADDFYLPNRFLLDKKIFTKNIIDGVYSMVGFEYYRETGLNESDLLKPCTLSKKLTAEELFDGIIASKYGHIHLNGLTIHKNVFDSIGLFNESLVVAEDSDFIMKLSLKCLLLPGKLAIPVSKRGVHDSNVFNQRGIYDIYINKYYESLISWSIDNNISSRKINKIIDTLWLVNYRNNKSVGYYLYLWILFLVKMPKLIIMKSMLTSFPIIKMRKKLFSFNSIGKLYDRE